NFLRGFVDWMVELLNAQTAFNGSVVLLKNTPGRSKAFERLLQQDGLYHLVTEGIQQGQLTRSMQRIECIQQIVHPYEQAEIFFQLATVPSLRVVISNTTEAGITFEPTDQFSDQPCGSFPAKLTQLLYRRVIHFEGALDKGWIVLPCELIPDNGQRLQAIVQQYAALWQLGQDFADWLAQSTIFCDTLVDRIVPGFPHQTAATVQAELGLQDELLVAAEPYHLWAIHAPKSIDSIFPIQQPQLNVHLVADLQVFRTRKVRILNAAHTIMVALGHAKGYRLVREFMEDQELVSFLDQLLEDEVFKTLNDPLPTLQAYKAAVFDRFRNPFIDHQLLDIALNSTAKFRVRVLPSILAYIDQFQQVPPLLTEAFAAFLLLLRDEQVRAKDQQGEYWGTQWGRAWAQRSSTEAWVGAVLAEEVLWGVDLSVVDGLVEVVSAGLTTVITNEE
ncbi:MAG: tagaturonate reductase, partial [Bacteroidota bacterium]